MKIYEIVEINIDRSVGSEVSQDNNGRVENNAGGKVESGDVKEVELKIGYEVCSGYNRSFRDGVSVGVGDSVD